MTGANHPRATYGEHQRDLHSSPAATGAAHLLERAGLLAKMDDSECLWLGNPDDTDREEGAPMTTEISVELLIDRIRISRVLRLILNVRRVPMKPKTNRHRLCHAVKRVSAFDRAQTPPANPRSEDGPDTAGPNRSVRAPAARATQSGTRKIAIISVNPPVIVASRC